ncbi:DinB family protein [Desertivirga brevis]|uniref:DinB family protein n=1 Tax=Desertivirga brevis TaxID=2810310 RepID=UPI001A957CEA|nr:DinB family protein [Pedobacter sp. SYSU D00873]
MAKIDAPEFWQRGPVPEIPALLQPVAHALLQAREEVKSIMGGFPDVLLWEKPAGMASCAFHLQHLSGVIDRLFTYARHESLSEQQFEDLAAEKIERGPDLTVDILVKRFEVQIDKALDQLRLTDESSLTDFRPVGRAGLPSNVLGLLFHSAEHTMRHVGQLLVTATFVQHKN